MTSRLVRSIAATASTTSKVVVWAPAKLNLFLELIRRRKDGFHGLTSLFVSVDRYDHLVLHPTSDPEIRVRCQWSPSQAVWQRRLRHSRGVSLELPEGSGNLVHRILKEFKDTFNCSLGFQVELTKSIPAGAGMGGASSNAAAALRAAACAVGIRLDDPRLQHIAANTGSDVPFFFGPAGVPSRAMVGTGRGERLKVVPVGRDLHFVVCFPPESLSTAEVYANCEVPKDPVPVSAFVDALSQGRMIGHLLLNRLSVPALRMSSYIWTLLKEMRHLGLTACQITGSGSACFAITPTRRVAQRAAKQLSSRNLGITMVLRTVTVPEPILL